MRLSFRSIFDLQISQVTWIAPINSRLDAERSKEIDCPAEFFTLPVSDMTPITLRFGPEAGLNPNPAEPEMNIDY